MMNRRTTAGMSLFECLVYVAILGVVINLSMSIFMSSSRMSTLATVALDRVNMTEDVRHAFTRAVHEAEGVASEAGSYKTGPEQLVLAYPPTPESDGWRRYVVFGRIAPSAGLGRLDILEKAGEVVIDGLVKYPLPVSKLDLSYDADSPDAARLVTLQVDVQMGSSRDVRPPKTHRFAASLRGGTR